MTRLLRDLPLSCSSGTIVRPSAVTAVDTTAGTIAISSTVHGVATTTTYTLAAGATITANGATTTLGSLLPGAQVTLQLSTIGTTTTVGSINAVTEHARGVVSSVDTTANTITITPHGRHRCIKLTRSRPGRQLR